MSEEPATVAEETLRERITDAIENEVIGSAARLAIDAVLDVLGDVVSAQPLRDLADEWEAYGMPGVRTYYAAQLRSLLPAAPTNTPNPDGL